MDAHVLQFKDFNITWKLSVAKSYGKCAKMSSGKEEWGKELRGFFGNYGFLCVGTLDWFHLYVNS